MIDMCVDLIAKVGFAAASLVAALGVILGVGWAMAMMLTLIGYIIGGHGL